jgi:hypothetical protein
VGVPNSNPPSAEAALQYAMFLYVEVPGVHRALLGLREERILCWCWEQHFWAESGRGEVLLLPRRRSCVGFAESVDFRMFFKMIRKKLAKSIHLILLWTSIFLA